jgi:hypothetical protein
MTVLTEFNDEQECQLTSVRGSQGPSIAAAIVVRVCAYSEVRLGGTWYSDDCAL